MFISTPFEMADLWGLQPGLLITSFADEDGVFEQYQAVVEDLASRVKAVSDPTRLIILRLIRHFGLTNTEIAAFVGVSRPTISEHVRILQEAGLVHSQKEGRTTKHQIDNAALWALLDDLQDMLDPTPRGDL
jgi:DNA-binding transcriptional ArsR family regulator